MESVPSVLAEVREFLAGLKLELPELFSRRPAPPPAVFEGRDGAEGIFAERAAHWAARVGVRYASIRVKEQRTLWGSCSRKGNLNFNWRLTLAPPEVLDYVVIHELVHLLEMNHSRRFWREVARHCPEYRAHRRWLRRRGGDLWAMDGMSTLKDE